MTNQHLPSLRGNWTTKTEFVTWLHEQDLFSQQGKKSWLTVTHLLNYIFVSAANDSWLITPGGYAFLSARWNYWSIRPRQDLNNREILAMSQIMQQPFYTHWVRSQITAIQVFDEKINMEWQLMDYNIHKWLDFRKIS